MYIMLWCSFIGELHVFSSQNISAESVVNFLNAEVSGVEEGLIHQLLASEHCTNSRDQKEFVSIITFTVVCAHSHSMTPRVNPLLMTHTHIHTRSLERTRNNRHSSSSPCVCWKT